MTLNNRIHVFAIFCVLAAACSRPAGDTDKSSAGNEQVTSTNVVKVVAEELTLGKGESGTAVVQLQIKNGYHVNANPASFPYLIATELKLTPQAGVSPGTITYPDPLTKTFSFSDAPLKVYEGDSTIKATLKADAAAPTGKHNLSAQMRVQACDDQVCYPPGTIDLTVPVTIK